MARARHFLASLTMRLSLERNTTSGHPVQGVPQRQAAANSDKVDDITNQKYRFGVLFDVYST